MVGLIPWHERGIERFSAGMDRVFNVFFDWRPFRRSICVVPMVLVFCMVGVATALPFHDDVAETRWISNTGDLAASNGWFRLGLPDWYDPNNVAAFAITMKGDDDNSPAYIDIFLDFDDTHTSGDYEWIAKYNVDKYVPFTLTLDIKNNDLLYGVNNNLNSVAGLANVDLEDFDGKDSFWVGYGCHFTHLQTGVDIAANPIPEPATLLLLGSGLIGLAGLGKRLKKTS